MRFYISIFGPPGDCDYWEWRRVDGDTLTLCTVCVHNVAPEPHVKFCARCSGITHEKCSIRGVCMNCAKGEL